VNVLMHSPAAPNRAWTLSEGRNGHPFMYQEWAGRANSLSSYWNHGTGGELPEAVGGGQHSLSRG